jgi:hypothetical protein
MQAAMTVDNQTPSRGARASLRARLDAILSPSRVLDAPA